MDKDQKYTIGYSFKNKMGISANNFVLLELIKDVSIMYTRKLQATEATTFDYTAPATGEYTWRMRSSSIGTTTTQPLTYSLDNLSIFYTYPYTVENCDNLADGYRFGFNTQEKDNEVYGAGNLNTALFWEYDTRLGRRWNVDPLPNSFLSPYSTFRNNPILFTDINGDHYYFSSNGTFEKSNDKTDNGVHLILLAGSVKGNTKYYYKLSDFPLNNPNNRKVFGKVLAKIAGEIGYRGTLRIKEEETKKEGSEDITLAYFNPDDNSLNVPYDNNKLNKTYNDYFATKTIMRHESIHKIGKFDNKTYLGHAEVYLDAMKHDDFKKSSKEFQLGQISQLANRMLNAANQDYNDNTKQTGVQYNSVMDDFNKHFEGQYVMSYSDISYTKQISIYDVKTILS